MSENVQEQACWLLLTYETGLTTRIISEIIVAWCYQGKRSLQEFFAASQQEWIDTCQLGAENVKKLEQAKEKLVGLAFLVEQLSHDHIHLLTLLDDDYPHLLKSSLKHDQTPPVLFYAGDLRIHERQTFAIIGSRKAGEESLAFTRAVSSYLAEQGANIISGNARGVDRTAYEGATSTQGCTTVVLPHGIRKLSGVQWRALLEKIEAGKVLLLSQFHPNAQWVVSRVVERNKVVVGLAQILIVAESNTEGGTWEGATGALRQNQPLYVRDSATSSSSSYLPGNKALIELGGHPLPWPTEQLADFLTPLIQKSVALFQVKDDEPSRPDQLQLFALTGE
jgi:DNA processing protein